MLEFMRQHMDKVIAAIIGLVLFGLARYSPKLLTRLTLIRVDLARVLYTLAGLCGVSFAGTNLVSWHRANDKQARFDDYVVSSYKANDIKTAKKQFDRALAWVNENHATHGFTSISYESPETDVSDWYDRVLVVEDDITSLYKNGESEDDAPKPWRNSMEKNKLVVPDDTGNIKVKSPDRLHLHPLSKEFFWVGAISGVGGWCFLALGLVTHIRRGITKKMANVA